MSMVNTAPRATPVAAPEPTKPIGAIADGWRSGVDDQQHRRHPSRKHGMFGTTTIVRDRPLTSGYRQVGTDSREDGTSSWFP